MYLAGAALGAAPGIAGEADVELVIEGADGDVPGTAAVEGVPATAGAGADAADAFSMSTGVLLPIFAKSGPILVFPSMMGRSKI